MSDNPFAPPAAVVADISLATEPSAIPLYFPVSSVKLVLLSFGTGGVYQYYWIYKNWRIIKARTGEDISPVGRTIFAYFFCHNLFGRIRDDLATAGKTVTLGSFATIWIICQVISNGKAGVFWLLGMISVFALLPVQFAVNEINARAAPLHDRNARFTVWNWLGLTIVIPLLLLTAGREIYSWR